MKPDELDEAIVDVDLEELDEAEELESEEEEQVHVEWAGFI
ncbi:hypothetical protein [Paenibacillus hamazuiensis]|nr:hypothetical protein [Paenibacillus hamazuiensis]